MMNPEIAEAVRDCVRTSIAAGKFLNTLDTAMTHFGTRIPSDPIVHEFHRSISSLGTENAVEYGLSAATVERFVSFSLFNSGEV